MKLINKAALVAEIKRLLSAFENSDEPVDRLRASVLRGLLSFTNTLEVKEVDLEKEIEEHVEGMPMSEFTHESEVDNHWDWARKEFHHFFELGLKAQKGEEV